jgi:hypothetical protein
MDPDRREFHLRSDSLVRMEERLAWVEESQSSDVEACALCQFCRLSKARHFIFILCEFTAFSFLKTGFLTESLFVLATFSV